MKQQAVLLLILGASLIANAARVNSEAELAARQLRSLQTTFTQHLEKETAKDTTAKTAYGGPEEHNEGPKDAPYYREHEHEDYYKPVLTESVCLREVFRRQCAQYGGGIGGPPTANITDIFSPAGRVQISDLGCCAEDDSYYAASASEKTKPAYYGPEGGHGEEYDILLPYDKGFRCNWQLTYLEQPVNISAYVERIGVADATCYFDEEAQKCSRALKDGTIITAKLDMFYVAAARKEPQVLGGLDDSCKALYDFGGGGSGGQGGRASGGSSMRGAGSTPDMISQMEAKMRGMLNAEGVKADTEGYGYRDHDKPYYRHHDHNYSGPDSDPSAGPVLVRGTAILLAGPITSITNMKHATEYKQGLMQFVPIFVPFPVINGSEALPLNSRPLVKPNSYKFVLAKGDY